MECIISNNDWLEARKKADLTKLPTQKVTGELDGTFKKLEID